MLVKKNTDYIVVNFRINPVDDYTIFFNLCYGLSCKIIEEKSIYIDLYWPEEKKLSKSLYLFTGSEKEIGWVRIIHDRSIWTIRDSSLSGSLLGRFYREAFRRECPTIFLGSDNNLLLKIKNTLDHIIKLNRYRMTY